MIWWFHICKKKYYLLALTDSIPRHEIDACFKFYIKDRYEPEGILIVLKKQQKSCLSCKKKYLKLNWHEYEFNMSRMEAIEDRKNVSILSFFWKSDYDFHDFFWLVRISWMSPPPFQNDANCLNIFFFFKNVHLHERHFLT